MLSRFVELIMESSSSKESWAQAQGCYLRPYPFRRPCYDRRNSDTCWSRVQAAE